MIRPMPFKFGVGFTASTDDFVDKNFENYSYEKIGDHNNFHVTKNDWKFPDIVVSSKKYLIDGFSPNLNKSLHVGHLRNLAIANSLFKILKTKHDVQFVAMLGASLGEKDNSMNELKKWMELLDYNPKIYLDIDLKLNSTKTKICNDEQSRYFGCEVWEGPIGDVIVKNIDGKPLYAYHDLCFLENVCPTHYITGSEQNEHFQSLGLESKHLPMGLVLGTDGKKLKSRSNDSPLALEIIDEIKLNLNSKDLDEAILDKIAWNILCWNFLKVSRNKNVKFDLKDWVNTSQGGMYITYTYARTVSAGIIPESMLGDPMDGDWLDEDIKILGYSEYYNFYLQESIEKLDPCPVANFCFELAKMITKAYEREQIKNGRKNFLKSLSHATFRLKQCMLQLGMFCLEKV